ncbi:smoothelin-like protein 1 [Heliangelus exortis]|uniref:smoothelin-like protein 1 n=1 Tax=Heliangelus exortis TaxID=472823 RepID=UPI003A91071F
MKTLGDTSTPTPDTLTPKTPTLDTPSHPSVEPGNGAVGGDGSDSQGERDVEDTGGDLRRTGGTEGDAKAEGAEGVGGNARDTGGNTQGTGDAVGDTKAGTAESAGGDTGDTGSDTRVTESGTKGTEGDTGDKGGGTRGTEGGTRGTEDSTRDAGCDTRGAGRDNKGTGGTGEAREEVAVPAAVDSTRAQQEPTWLQDEDEELWPEFPPCSPTEGAASPTSPMSPTCPVSPTSPTSPVSPMAPPASTTGGSGVSERAAPVGGVQGRALPGTVGLRPRLDGAGGRPRVSPRAQGRSAILEKFGGAAKGPAPHLKRAGGTATVKAMLLEWCRSRTRGYQNVDVQNFSGSWGSGLAFCALLHSFFPDAFDFATLDPHNRHHNFTLAFTIAEERVGCPPLLEVEDMVQMPVPDAKCVYTYLQELYRCLVGKGLVRTRQR